jgi:hypothetical protein
MRLLGRDVLKVRNFDFFNVAEELLDFTKFVARANNGTNALLFIKQRSEVRFGQLKHLVLFGGPDAVCKFSAKAECKLIINE